MTAQPKIDPLLLQQSCKRLRQMLEGYSGSEPEAALCLKGLTPLFDDVMADKIHTPRRGMALCAYYFVEGRLRQHRELEEAFAGFSAALQGLDDATLKALRNRISTIEPVIRQIATELDDLVSAARPELDALNVDIQTVSPSGRDYTIWTGRFAKHWPTPTGVEQVSVTINLECMVPLHPTEIKDVEVTCHATAEIFQIGKSSRVRKDTEARLLLGQLRSSGIQNILLEKIEWGRTLLTTVNSAD